MVKTLRVVSVDDHYLIHQAVRSLLADYPDIELVAEGNAGEHVFPLVERHRPDALILDLLMPRSAGGDPETDSFMPVPALERLRQEYPETAIIILSQYLNMRVVESAIQHGVRGYLLKSDNLSLSLPDAIKRVSVGGVFFSDQVSKALFDRTRAAREDLLTLRQRQIVLAIAKSPNTSYAELADRLSISHRTFKGHLDGAYKALEVNNITACVIRCMQLGLIPFSQNGHGIRFGDL